MRMLLLALAAVASLSLSACGSDEKTVVVTPPGSNTVVVPGDAKVCPAGTVC